MNPVKTALDDLREKRLWPVAVALLAALVAVPMLLSKSATTKPLAAVSAPVGPAGAPASPSSAAPVVSLINTPSQSRLRGAAHDPFAQQPAAAGSVTGGATTSGQAASALARAVGATSSKTPSASSGKSATSGSSTGGTSAKSTTTSTSTTPSTTTTTPTTPTPTPPKVVSVLSDTESYHVALAMTKLDGSGGLDTLDPLERLSVLPNKQLPLMVELGVLKGGHRVLFALQPGAVVSGPGTCTPGPIDCEVLSLGANQIENLGVQSATSVSPVTMFAVTAIRIDRHRSAGDAGKARSKVSAAGRSLLKSSGLSALSLFQYKPSLGAVVNLQNLKVGGST